MFRKLFEANDDGGGGAATAGSQPVTDDYLGLGGGTDGADLIVEAVRAANAEPPAGGDGGAADDPGSGGAAPPADGGQGGTQDLILGRFKDNEALAQSYQSLEGEYTQTRQRLSDYEAQIQQLQQQLQQPQ